MIFAKYIRSNRYLNMLAIKFLNKIIQIIRFFLITDNSNSSNVVIIALHRLGDAVFTISAIMNITNHYKSKCYLICYDDIKSIYQIVFDNINFVTLNRNDFCINKRFASFKSRKILKDLKPETIYDMTGDATSASLIFTSSAKKIIGINELYFKTIYTHFTNIRKLPHMVDIYLDPLKELMPIKYHKPLIKDKLYPINKILLHPFASCSAKEWGLNNFIKLAETLNSIAVCYFICPPNTISFDVKHEMFRKEIKILETCSTEDLIKEINNASLLIGNDSAAVHIANLLGIPTFTIYGPTNPLYPKPLFGINQFVYGNKPCSPGLDDKWCFLQAGLFCPSNECMKSLSIEDVERRVFKLINDINNIKK